MSVAHPEEPVAPVRRRGRPPATDRGAADTAARIRAAALELFAERGFHATGVAEIGARADVQRGALYYHIGSKEELLWEILGEYTRLLLADAERIVGAGADPVATLRLLVRSHVELIVTHRRAVAVHLRDADALTGARAAELQQLRDRLQQLWQEVIDAGYAAGRLRTADHIVTNGLLGMLNSLGFWYRERGAHSPAEIADILTDTVLSGLAVTDDNTKG
ncbi:TetR/AcrR family transcriptional regulator [Nocardia asteroides NBRC 15531]|uniref:TetR family transcriptional regulator n=1 Tax=Nocardia asteroides NBRC 15531 TaxID=1110697 RepID=U5EJC2_NOCAS|nr:TetR/AcrR family transcriptional regulator [Nocardia asteroides]TLF67040.1 TetR/AcrR family transcriptional regulator [Nocardia asteroides NBRC 15531]UGT51693.1 TetR/AcrR family transcriptional regulator [Nocardia asteroides]SFM19473.1 transcriptional regulator, TetR family [Nocardia asteroides]VEG35403.1 HTH-type transcriptional repressor KstR2 [Nocardia asteroides]GAD86438.1 putative TetR family transcriptional regulator [Nocardia asteroides NBRC 15531]